MSSAGRSYRLGVLLGDGIGPEIVPVSVRVVDAALAAVGAGVSTRDLGGTASTGEFTDAVVRRLAER